MYTYQTLTEETLDELKVGDEFQIFPLYNRNRELFPQSRTPQIIADNHSWITGGMNYSSLFTGQIDPYKNYTIPNCTFVTVTRRTKRVVEFSPCHYWLPKFRYHQFIGNNGGYIILKKLQVIDLDIDDDECI